MRPGLFFTLCWLAPAWLLHAAESSAAASYFTRPGTELLVSNLPPPRDQGELAFCYAAVPAVLLDRHRCRREQLDCPALTPAEQVSMLDIAGQNDADGPTLHEFGSIIRVFRGLIQRAGNGRLYIPRESCMPYAALDRLDMPERPAHLHLRAGWNSLRNLFDTNRLGNDRRPLPRVREALAVRLELPAPPARQDAALRRVRSGALTEFDRFAWEMLSNPACNHGPNRVGIPGFRARAWPESDQAIDAAALQAKILGLLQRDLPVSLSYCARWEERDGDQQCWNRAGHASIVVGQREVCSRDTGDCQLLFKLLNSFGRDWNTRDLQVWVPAAALLDAALELKRTAHLLVWLE